MNLGIGVMSGKSENLADKTQAKQASCHWGPKALAIGVFFVGR